MTIPRKPRAVSSTASLRIRRVPPRRSEPLRDWPGALRSTGLSTSKNGNELAPAMTQDSATASDAGFDGVSHGYQLIEEHIRRARAAAIGAHKAPKRKKAGSTKDEDVRAVVAQIFRSLSELLPVIGDLFNRLGAEGITRLLTSNTLRPSTEASALTITEAGSRVRIEISSSRHAEVTLELRGSAERLNLSAHPLITANSRNGAIKAIRFSPAKRGGPSKVSIRIPNHQAPGTYSGAVVDGRSGEPQGVLTVRIRK